MKDPPTVMATELGLKLLSRKAEEMRKENFRGT